MDIVCEIMRVDGPSNDGDPQWVLGDIVDVREVGKLWQGQDWPEDPALTNPNDLVSAAPRKAYVVVQGLPAAAPEIARIRQILTEQHTVNGNNIEAVDVLGNREWHFHWDALANAAKRAITTEPYVLVTTWNHLRGAIVRGRRRQVYMDDVHFA